MARMNQSDCLKSWAISPNFLDGSNLNGDFSAAPPHIWRLVESRYFKSNIFFEIVCLPAVSL